MLHGGCACTRVAIGRGGGVDFCAREEITPHKHVGEITQKYLLCTLQMYPTHSFLPPLSRALQPRAFAHGVSRRKGSK